jgi:hypothetical protein
MMDEWNKTHVVDLVKGNVSSVLDVLLLLSVPWGFWALVFVVGNGMAGGLVGHLLLYLPSRDPSPFQFPNLLPPPDTRPYP